MEQIQDNYRFWKNLVGLPHGFPELSPLGDEELLTKTVVSSDWEKTILNSISAKPLTAVIVNEGNGLTTLFRYIQHICEDKSIDSLTIAVGVDMAGTDLPSSPEGLEFQIKKQVLQNLVSSSWEEKLDLAHYYYCINYLEDRDFYVHRAEMGKLLQEKIKNERQLKTYFPFAGKNLADFVNYLLEKMRIQTVMLWHFPRSCSEETMLGFSKSTKIVREQNHFQEAAIREVFFCTPSVRKLLTRDYKQAIYDLLYPNYTGAQIFAMLVKRYRSVLPGQKGRQDFLGLGEVFAQDFVQAARFDQEPLVDTMQRVNRLIEKSFDRERKEVPFKLEPTKDALAIALAERQANEQQQVSGKKFQRIKRNV